MTRIEMVMQYVRDRIKNKHWMAGAKVSSIRQAAVDLAVSKNTVTEAYDRLVAAGWLEPRPGSGYFVPEHRQSKRVAKVVSVAQAVDAATLLREQLIKHYEVRVGEGRPPLAWTASLDFRAPKYRPADYGSGSAHGYDNPWGYDKLRAYLTKNFRDRGIVAYEENILTTFGANHALDLIVRQYLEPGDTVLVDSPGYYPLFAKLHLAGVNMVGVKRNVNGPDIKDLQAKALQYKPKMFFTQSQGHNPTGGYLSLSVGHRILLESAKHNFLVVEDDPFADILPGHLPRLVNLDQLERVIYIGTFSKTLSAGLRLGYLAANEDIAAALCDLKMLTMASSSGISERMLYEFIAAGSYLKYIRKLKSKVQVCSKQSIAALRQIGLDVFCEPANGFYMWVYLSPQDNEQSLVSDASDKNIFIAPGHLFIPDQQEHRPAMRVNIAYASDPRFVSFMQSRLT